MLTERIIGRVGADILAKRITNPADDAVALFRLDKLSSNQIAAVAREILTDNDLFAQVDLRIPEILVRGEGLPENILIQHNAGFVRNNAETSKAAILTANGNEHNLSDTLGHVMAIGAKEMRADAKPWVDAVLHSAGISIVKEDQAIFQAALAGLLGSYELSLTQLGEFCSEIASAISAHGLAIRDAVGFSLPKVGLPRDTAFFSNSKTYSTSRNPWYKAFTKLFLQRAPLLKKLKQNGQPIDLDDLRERFCEHKEEFSEEACQALEKFIESPAGDNSAVTELLIFEWEKDGIYLVFDKPKEKLLGLSDATIEFFDHDCEPENSLSEDSRRLLEELKVRERRADFTEEDEDFFIKHRRLLEQDVKLCSRWEKALYGKPIECHDFFDGFARAVHNLYAGVRESGSPCFLRFTVNKGRKEWRERFNYDAGSFFSSMYRGIKELMGSKVDWKVERMGSLNLPDPLFDYESFFAKEKEYYLNKKTKLKSNSSLSKAALNIKFDVALIRKEKGEEIILAKTQLLWSYRPASIGLSMTGDMRRLLEKGGVGRTEVSRKLVSKKGGVQSVSLFDTGSLEATYGRDAGSLVPPSNRLRSQRAEIKRRIQELADVGRLKPEQRDEIRIAWDKFEEDYNQALVEFINTGLHGEAIMLQAESFSALLSTLLVHARGDICREKLVSEVLAIGTVRVVGDNPALIIPPWHPERMKALAVKSKRITGFAKHLLSSNNILFSDREIFMRELSDEIAHPFYPEIGVLDWEGRSILVSESSTVNGYSLLESPTRGIEDSMTNVDPSLAAKQARELLERYVGLQPHEASNLNVVLYNSDAAELPLATVREISSMQSHGKLQCSVSMRHSNQSKLRSVYGELVNKVDDAPDLPLVSETSDNFISKLRISVTPNSATPLKNRQGFKPFDIAFLHDVVSRSAKLDWVRVEWTNERANLEHAPSRCSYRSVSGENELKSSAFLTCPEQTSTGWTYISAVWAVSRQSDVLANERHLPVRLISLQDPDLATMIKDAHDLAEWVAIYDELLDKRQLQYNGITIVRYRRSSTNGRNIIVSSTSELRLLSVLVRRRLGELNLKIEDEVLNKTAERAKIDALSISGDIVLRAAKRGISAGEMLGLVFSRYLLAEELKQSTSNNQTLTAYFLLDDYARWLSQPESRIADIMALTVVETDDKISISIVIVESKYVGLDGLAKARRDSKDQLLATLNVFREALFGDPGRLDRDIWLSRLANMLLDAEIPPGMTGLMERARMKLREGDIEISLRGYSHVYIHTSDTDTGTKSEQELLEEQEGVKAWQIIFARPELRKIAECYSKEEFDSAVGLCEIMGTLLPWGNYTFQKPAHKVAWLDSFGEFVPPSITPESDLPSLVSENGTLQHKIKTLDSSCLENNTSPLISHELEIQSSENINIYGKELSKLITSKYAGKIQSDTEREAWGKEVTQKLKVALNSYGFQASVINTRLTPNGCLVRLAGSDRLRVEDIENKRTQLMTTHAINLVTVQPKPGEIVVTIAGAKRQSVALWELWAQREINRNTAGINTSFLLGVQEVNGALLYLNLGSEFGGLSSHEPHSLVAGATGSGKSVLIQSLLLDIAATNSANLAKIILIDPKMGVDYAPLADLPHMREEIIITKERSKEVLAALVEEMEDRYRAFANARARDLSTYNGKVPYEEQLPMVFLVHDEFADWMFDDEYKSAVSAAVQRLGVKARAAGIHLIFAAQRPDKDVMPMQLRENLGNRLILKVASEATSKIALDRSGAELLLGKGHLAAKLSGEHGLVFAQAPFLSDEDIIQAVEAIRIDFSTVAHDMELVQ
ncbi:DNA translocase FtsK [Salmonella enterica subsp. enterica]|uniref:FtsK/SpoIIIE domain-containing protein n=1 Tax=Salmonella enterica TaxID=28901 RepID=UPI000FA8A9E5|nr:FtsK/SpoIIIE domain-containing protein [Salmonella enterica]EBA0747399.1 DNA translocase FtsK [Salmonella enterica subsp. enterica]EBC9934502.1 DNA translocase FtsK [Salmonella enterica subsp. enterica serovar Nigeria]EHL9704051.1 DNA translocase FtsK [Salmonella enterica subsp. enterica serovar Infantis]EBB5462625.1 DNA translocase FtsK [Salmonella enterica subsp. enterica]EBE4086827.1 DNA translocase FtsK [Salmonella enterica subsp. enterica serovar Nigeria]